MSGTGMGGLKATKQLAGAAEGGLGQLMYGRIGAASHRVRGSLARSGASARRCGEDAWRSPSRCNLALVRSHCLRPIFVACCH